MKVWIKIYLGDKILNSSVLYRKGVSTRQKFDSVLREFCHDNDLSTPVVLSSHYSHFNNFNMTKFIPRDFMEEVNFDSLTVENCPEDD